MPVPTRPLVSRSQQIFERIMKKPGRFSLFNTACLLTHPNVPTTECCCGTNEDGSIWVKSPGGNRLTIPAASFDQLLPGLKNKIRDTGGKADFTGDELACVRDESI